MRHKLSWYVETISWNLLHFLFASVCLAGGIGVLSLAWRMARWAIVG